MTWEITRAIEIRCTQCGELVRLKTPTKSVRQATAIMQSLVDGAASSCHDAELVGRLLGYREQADASFDVSDLPDAIVEIGPNRSVRLQDHRTEEWSTEDVTPVQNPGATKALRRRAKEPLP